MKRWMSVVVVLVAVVLTAHGLAQTRAKAQNVPEIPFESVPNFLKMPAGRVSRREHGRRDQLEGAHLRLPPARRHAPVRVRPERHLRQGVGRGHLRLRVRAQGARRQGRQRLGGRRGDEHGHQVQPRRPGRDGARPPARGGRRRGRDAAGRSAAGRAVSLCAPDRRRRGMRRATSSCPTATSTTAS